MPSPDKVLEAALTDAEAIKSELRTRLAAAERMAISI
jgi:hypothetical protein